MKSIKTAIITLTLLVITSGLACAGGPSTVLNYFGGNGIGYLTSANATHTEYEGNSILSHMGRVSWTAYLNFDWTIAQSNGEAGLCTNASGRAYLENRAGTMEIWMVGSFCSQSSWRDGMGGQGPVPPFTYNATYFITDGTGNYEDAEGSGTLIASTKCVPGTTCIGEDNGTILVFMNGSLIK